VRYLIQRVKTKSDNRLAYGPDSVSREKDLNKKCETGTVQQGHNLGLLKPLGKGGKTAKIGFMPEVTAPDHAWQSLQRVPLDFAVFHDQHQALLRRM
jgi:hypothetical protein